MSSRQRPTPLAGVRGEAMFSDVCAPRIGNEKVNHVSESKAEAYFISKAKG